MAINFSNNDYSYLFKGLTSQASGINQASSLLSDYASIKNGSYGKLMKAYYGANESKGTNASKTSTDKSGSAKEDPVVKSLNKVQTATDNLKSSADAITKKETIGYDDIKSFVDDYNSLISAANKISDGSTVNRTTRLVGDTLANNKLLRSVGITINEDSTLSVDKDTFEKANKLTVDSLFKGAGSYGDKISSQASLIKYSADRAVTKAGGTYTAKGNYDTATAAGNLYNSYT